MSVLIEFDIFKEPFNKVPNLISIERKGYGYAMGWALAISGTSTVPKNSQNNDRDIILTLRDGTELEFNDEEFRIIIELLYRGRSFKDAIMVARI